jgi:hypothetical protein
VWRETEAARLRGRWCECSCDVHLCFSCDVHLCFFCIAPQVVRVLL